MGIQTVHYKKIQVNTREDSYGGKENLEYKTYQKTPAK